MIKVNSSYARFCLIEIKEVIEIIGITIGITLSNMFYYGKMEWKYEKVSLILNCIQFKKGSFLMYNFFFRVLLTLYN